MTAALERSVQISIGKVTLEGDLALPKDSRGIVLFAHGSGSSRKSSRNRYVAKVLQEAGLSTLLFDLLTREEEKIDMYTMQLRFDISLLADRLAGATDWILQYEHTKHLRIGYFGASTGAAAALVAATSKPVHAVVSRGGRPDLAYDFLPKVTAPTLLIVGGDDEPVIDLNKKAKSQMKAVCDLVIVPGATHLFEEPGKLERVSILARDWFKKYLDR